MVHLLNLANDVIVFDEDNGNPLITSLLNSVKELKENVKSEVCCLIEEYHFIIFILIFTGKHSCILKLS